MFRILLAIYIVAGSLCFAQTITYSNQDSIPGYQKILKSQIIKMEADSAFLYNSRAHEILSRKPNELRNIFALIENERKLHYEMIDSLKKTIDGLTTLGK
ncbi:MAG: hypothetical protein LWX56_02110, partial [Ignavibacteria bacterium]|nr:hypothetical protein [Ignavibacteria bacterium]